MSKIEELKKQIQELEKQTKELQQELEFEKKKIEYPFEENDLYWSIDIDGDLCQDQWNCSGFDKNCFKLGNAFKTEQEALKELDRRILLTRFRQFRDKCNGGQRLDDVCQTKYFIAYSEYSGELFVGTNNLADYFVRFGYFANIDDAEEAIHVFGSEIKRLWVEEIK